MRRRVCRTQATRQQIFAAEATTIQPEIRRRCFKPAPQTNNNVMPPSKRESPRRVLSCIPHRF
jgi:hypothetical protein